MAVGIQFDAAFWLQDDKRLAAMVSAAVRECNPFRENDGDIVFYAANGLCGTRL